LSQATRRLAAIMFTDMVGYTALAQRDESLSLSLVEEQKGMVRPILGRHHGREVKTMGDAFLVEFSSALAAVKCAYDIQKAARERNVALPEERKIRLRIGIHLGDVVESQGDISGDAVNVASRIEPLAEAGGVCLTRQVYDQVMNKVELPLSSVGTRVLKNVDAPVEVFRMAMPWEETKASPEPAREKRRIAVLPLANLSPDRADEYLADGMTEELIMALSGVRELTVVARTSVMRYKGSPKGASEIGKDLNVGTLVEGSVRKSGNRVRVTVQLIDTGSEGHLWAQNYDRQLDDIFEIQTEIAEKVAKELRIQLLESEKRRLEARPTTDAEAYTLYMKGRHFWNDRSDEGVRKAIAYFEHAIEKDPKFALGYSGLADCYAVMARNSQAEFEPAFKRAKEYAAKALELDDGIAETHAALANILLYYDHDWRRSEAEFLRAIELKPSYPTAHQWYSHLLEQQRRFSEAGREIMTALRLDPFSPVINMNAGAWYYYEKDFDKAIEIYNRAREIDPAFTGIYGTSGIIEAYVQKGDFEAALKEVEALGTTTNRVREQRLMTAYVLAAMGRKSEARELLKEVESEWRIENINPYVIALVYFVLRDDDAGFRWLDTSYDVHDGALNLVGIDFELDHVRDDPRYLSILERVGLGHR
jgi:adenylate cyclase